VNIDRINVIQIVLNLAVDMFKFGNKTVQKLQMMHGTQGFGDIGCPQDILKD
jgi:hypothetical protein